MIIRKTDLESKPSSDLQNQKQDLTAVKTAYQKQITPKIQAILQGKDSISFEQLLKTNKDIASIYSNLSDNGKKLVEYVISLDDDKENVSEKELRNLYRLMDMSGGNHEFSFYDGDISDHTAGKVIDYLARGGPSNIVKQKLITAHRLTRTTLELAEEEKSKNTSEYGIPNGKTGRNLNNTSENGISNGKTRPYLNIKS